MQLIIISGRSGSGKSTALNQLEDEGFYCIDNLPISLLPALIEKIGGDEFSIFQGIAVCIDARNAWKDLRKFEAIIHSLPLSVETQVLFLDAQEINLLQRFSETRRRHPLSTEFIPLAEAIDKERELLEPIYDCASLVLDTSHMTVYDLRDAIKQRLLGSSVGSMAILLQSFGFKRRRPRVRCKNVTQSPLGKGVATQEWARLRSASVSRKPAYDRGAVSGYLPLSGQLAAALS